MSVGGLYPVAWILLQCACHIFTTLPKVFSLAVVIDQENTRIGGPKVFESNYEFVLACAMVLTSSLISKPYRSSAACAQVGYHRLAEINIIAP